MVQPCQLALPPPLPVSAGPSVPLCGSMTEPHSLHHLLSLEAWTPWLWDCRAASLHGLAMLSFQAILTNPEQSDSLVFSRIPHISHPLVDMVVHQVCLSLTETRGRHRMTGQGCLLSPFRKGPSGLVFSALGNIGAPQPSSLPLRVIKLRLVTCCSLSPGDKQGA